MLLVASGVAGAALTIGVLAATGSVGTRVSPRAVIERQTVTPVLATNVASDDDAARLAGPVTASVVLLHVDANAQPAGAGVVFRNDGHVLTNAHVIGAASTVTATLASGRTVAAKVIATDASTDLAVLKLSGNGPFVPAVLGTSNGAAVGDVAIAVGSRASAGVISALGRDITAAPGRSLEDLIQTDADIDATSSGGALVDADGTVIGITTAEAGTSRVSYATPIDVARAVADDLLSVGHVRTVWLGIKGTEAPGGAGVVIADVIAGGPAQLAGLTAGDVVRRLDRRPLASMSALRVALRRHHPGDPVRVVFDRDGRRQDVPVVLAERPTAG